ncbi:shikimate kinase [Cyclobacteriaceae bacterium]|jgi:shikimate kinase|nr:shikimate kinase [Cyclobacteriaceae bacterium]MDC6483773.1 shikimate kinase [Cyclobacteriaceae bacterium]
MKPIFLIGLPGSGKSIFGKSLAATLDLNHVDLDQVIESKTNKSIDALFEIHGEAYFREIEKNALQELLEKSSTDILSCGGGTPCFYDNMSRMNVAGLTIFLDIPVSTIVKRIAENHDRPLLKNKNLEKKITQLRVERLQYYHQAQLIFNETHDPIESVGEIQSFLKIQSKGQ